MNDEKEVAPVVQAEAIDTWHRLHNFMTEYKVAIEHSARAIIILLVVVAIGMHFQPTIYGRETLTTMAILIAQTVSFAVLGEISGPTSARFQVMIFLKALNVMVATFALTATWI